MKNAFGHQAYLSVQFHSHGWFKHYLADTLSFGSNFSIGNKNYSAYWASSTLYSKSYINSFFIGMCYFGLPCISLPFLL